MDNKPAPNTSSEEIFILKNEPPKPPSKKSVWTTIGITLGAVFVLVVVLLATLYMSASTVAGNYGSLALEQLKKIDKPLAAISPSEVLNKRDITSSVNDIYVSKQAQPSLENVLFVGSLNQKYQAAVLAETDTKKHYETIGQYTDALTGLLLFTDKIVALSQQDSDLETKAVQTDSLSIRSVAGNYNETSEELASLEVPEYLESTRDKAVSLYEARSVEYEAWAKEIEAGNTTTAAAHQQQIQNNKKALTVLVSEAKLIQIYEKAYKPILQQQDELKGALSKL